MVRSTIQRLGKTTNVPTSDRLTISTLICRQDTLQSVLEFRALVSAVGIKLEQERIQTKQRRHPQQAAVTVLEVGGVDDRAQQ